MRLLITGGTGFIGSALALRAGERGLDIIVAGRVNTPAERARLTILGQFGIAVDDGPLQDPGYSRKIAQGCDVVVHLAAAQHEANVPDSYFFDTNVEGTRALLDASIAARVRRFVYGSTIGVYGEAGESILDETSPPHPANVYGRTKLAAEHVVKSYGGSLGVSIVRISETYGPGDFRLLKLFRAIAKGRFFIIGSGLNKHQVIHVDDLITGLLLAAERPEAVDELFVLAGSEIITTREMVERVARAVGRAPPRIRLPLWPFSALALTLEKGLQPFGIQPPLHRRRLDFFRRSFVFSTEKASGLLGFTPRISFADGARATAGWYRSHGYL